MKVTKGSYAQSSWYLLAILPALLLSFIPLLGTLLGLFAGAYLISWYLSVKRGIRFDSRAAFTVSFLASGELFLFSLLLLFLLSVPLSQRLFLYGLLGLLLNTLLLCMGIMTFNRVGAGEPSHAKRGSKG